MNSYLAKQRNVTNLTNVSWIGEFAKMSSYKSVFKHLSISLMMSLASFAVAQTSSYRLPVKLSSVQNQTFLKGNPDMEEKGLNKAQRTALSKNGFVIRPASWQQFDAVYEDTRYMLEPVFITTDSMLHIYHLIFNKLLRDLERESLEPALKKMNHLLVKDAQAQLVKYKGTALEEDAKRVLAYVAVAQQLADPKAKPPAEVADLVNKEVDAASKASGAGMSAIFKELQMDYSQYIPRGHYTRSEQLKTYFKGMMWLGNVNMRVSKSSEIRTAALLAHLIDQNAEVKKLWSQIYDSTTLLVGASDDLNYRQVIEALKKVTGGDLKQLADQNKLSQFQTALLAFPPPKVNSMFTEAQDGEGVEARQKATQGFRVMGQRFTLDAAALQELVYRSVGTMDNPRLFPKGLDLMAVLGSDAALNELRKMGASKYANYDQQMQKMRNQFAELKEEDWNANVYSGWIYTLQGLAQVEPKDKRYPAFMRTPAWSRKELLTALGSWTELKHDTILYAKQLMAEMGAAEPPKSPRGYVEPNALVWKRLLKLTELTHNVLTEQKILSETTEGNLNQLSKKLKFLQKATEYQLSGRTLSDEEYDDIHYYGGWLEMMKIASADPARNDQDAGRDFNENDMAAIVADVATQQSSALEEGTGFIHELYAIIPNGQGGIQIARGGIYSQYEFTVPSSKRLTNEKWRERLKKGDIPPTHPWLKGIVVE